MPELFAQVIVPLPLHDSFTYKVPDELQGLVGPGKRVTVQFGKRKFYAALVTSLTNTPPENVKLKSVVQLLDEKPVVLPKNIELWKWIADYYCCTLGDIFKAALPSGLKLESKSKVFLTGKDDEAEVRDNEFKILQELKQSDLSLDELQKKLGSNFSYTALKHLLDKKIIGIEEKISKKYRPKTETFVQLHSAIKSNELLNSAIESLARK